MTVWLILIASAIAAVWVYWRRSDALLNKFNGQTHFSVARYLVGLEGVDIPTPNVECVVTPRDLVFAKLWSARELGRIPRNSISEVVTEDKSQLAQRLTVTRLVALGMLALAVPKTRKIQEWCVAIKWKDSRGVPRATVFEFAGPNPSGDANKAANYVLKYVLSTGQE